MSGATVYNSRTRDTSLIFSPNRISTVPTYCGEQLTRRLFAVRPYDKQQRELKEVRDFEVKGSR